MKGRKVVVNKFVSLSGIDRICEADGSNPLDDLWSLTRSIEDENKSFRYDYMDGDDKESAKLKKKLKPRWSI